MPDEFRLIVSPGAVRLERHWLPDPERPELKPFGWHQRWGANAPNSLPKRRRGDGGQSARSRSNMRWTFMSLPWERLGPRLVMLSLTYPGEWRQWVPDGRTWDAHRRAFLERWRRRWGTPAGVWVKEFQESGRPHLHLYLAIPDEVPVEEYEGLRQRTILRRRLEYQHGRFEGRAKLPAIGGKYGGEFAMWLRTAWSEVVGTQGVVKAHHARGVDVAVSFWTDEVARTKDRREVALYMAGESAKWKQKAPPDGFKGVGRYYNYIGKTVGFEPDLSEMVVSHAVAYELERRLERLVRWRILAKRARYGNNTGPITFDLRRSGNGVQAFGVKREEVPKLLARCELAAARKEARRTNSKPFVWGPTYLGFPAHALVEAGGEDGDSWSRRPDPVDEYLERLETPKWCGCEYNEICEDCAPPHIQRRWAANCGCKGDQVCIDCCDPASIPPEFA